MNRSIPLEKALDDAMIALYQNQQGADPVPLAVALGRPADRAAEPRLG